jgi:hypothetical protein
MTSLRIASMMVCGAPKCVGGRFLLSADYCVWEPVLSLPEGIANLFTDEIGNDHPATFGNLQMKTPNALKLLDKEGYFGCFRSVAPQLIEHVGVVPATKVYEDVWENLEMVGWDLCSSNNWSSASIHGSYPVNIRTGDIADKDRNLINSFSLFKNLEDCERQCALNDAETPDHSPWYPVAVHISVTTKLKLLKLESKP